MTLPCAVVLGGLGQVGDLIGRTLAKTEREVLLVDVLPKPAAIAAADYLHTDVTKPGDVLLGAIAAADCVAMCLPERAALAAAPAVLDAMSRGALWVDTLSVKENIVALLRRYEEKLELVSINPMFAPALGFEGHTVAFIEIAGGPKSADFARTLRSLGATVETVTAETHDRLTAAIQVATHAAILSFGAVLLELGYDLDKGLAIATPPHLSLLSLLHRLSSANPEVYWDIQHHHPLAASVRESLNDAVRALDYAAREDSPREFQKLFERLRLLLSNTFFEGTGRS
ncbi:MAG: 4-amino-4-deoxyprephenate dehydrogenase [Acidobacteriota bacterium]|jgi:prephenate dehydrogenase